MWMVKETCSEQMTREEQDSAQILCSNGVAPYPKAIGLHQYSYSGNVP